MKKIFLLAIYLAFHCFSICSKAQTIDSTSYGRDEDEDEKSMQASCGGTELWSLKVLTDPAASTVNYVPVGSTVAALVGLSTPTPSSNMPRTGPIEKTTYIINCTITIKKVESDNDYHLVLSDGTHTLIGEIPDPNCTAALTSSHRTQFVAAKAFIDAHIASGNVFNVTIPQVTVTGVGFIDPPHGQTGAAPNNLELHPILDIHFTSANLPPTASFAIAASDCVGQPISLSDNSTNGPTSWNWTMTGGTPASSTLQNPSVTYSTAGSHTVTLTATNSSGSSSPISHTITVNANPSVPTITLSGSTLTSSATSGNQWYLNGVLISGATGQTYIAPSTGAYTVAVTNSHGCTSISAPTNYNSNNPPTANFIIAAADCEGEAIPLADNSTDTPTSWNWTMIGGTPSSSSSQNPLVTYNTAGTYTVTLTATNSSGTSAPVSHTIIVNALPPIPTITVSGTALTSSATIGNQWYLNGALIIGDTLPMDTATSIGSYTVVVTNTFGCSNSSAPANFNNNNPPVADFTASTPACAGLTNVLADNSTNTPTSWNWTMIGGIPSSSSLQNPSVTYTTAGTYTITLVCSNSSGSSAPLSNTITVNASPAIPVITLVGSTLTSSAPSGNQWYLNGSFLNGEANQTCAATSNGSYTVAVTNSFGCSTTSVPINFFSTGINSVTDNNRVTIFYNPINKSAQINFTEKSDHIIIDVINDIGQQVYTEKMNDCPNLCNETIDMSSLKQGVYLFRIMANGNIHTKKIVLVN